MTPSVVLSRPSPCNVPQGYASVADLPAALLGCHFEHPAFGRCLVMRAVGSTCATPAGDISHYAIHYVFRGLWVV
jgi:hypothetical protein